MAGLNGVKYELSQEQLQALKEEISSDPQGNGYVGCTRGGVCRLLNEKPLIDNPDPQGQIDGPPISPGELLSAAGLTLAEIGAIQADAEGASVWNMFLSLPEIDLNADLAAECLATLQDKALLSAERVQAIQALGKIPDPAWQAQVPGQSRAEELLGLDGIMIEGADIGAAQTL